MFSLSFALGCALLTISGIAGSYLGVDPLIPQAALAIVCVSVSAYWSAHRTIGIGELDRDDRIVIGLASLYLIIGLLFFNRIVMWMSGDAVAHAELIRTLLDGGRLPVGLPRVGSYFEYYPKGFHHYAYPFARIFPLLDVMQVLPVVITSITPLLLYSIVREMRAEVSTYAAALATFIFPAHYSHLIWSGYPTATAEMFLVASVLSCIIDIRALPVMLLGTFLAHARMLAIAIAVLSSWVAAAGLRRFRVLHQQLLIATAVAAVALYLILHPPDYLISIFSDRIQASDFVARWYPSIIALFGGVIAFMRDDRLDRMMLAWSGAVIGMVLLADSGLLSFVGTPDRLLLELYLPLSVLGALALARMDGGDLRLRRAFVLVLLLVGVVSMVVVLESYAGSWGMPREDYDAIMWIKAQNLSDAVCVNLDETGAWIYPLTGIRVARGRFTGSLNYALPGMVIRDPNDPAVIESLERLGRRNVLVYVSSVSIRRPGHVPPFAEHHGAYPRVNMSFSPEHYELVYDMGARIYRFR
ncbi:MAG: hypothetical protein H5T42_06490 [Methanothrix sp.]|uniref:hypothetical protein n=2 Tax=Methanotrichaceae TaxID=143067 RepID=UPI0019AC8DFD|nr:hypothetical protein [Methanothrix sp.]